MTTSVTTGGVCPVLVGPGGREEEGVVGRWGIVVEEPGGRGGRPLLLPPPPPPTPVVLSSSEEYPL